MASLPPERKWLFSALCYPQGECCHHVRWLCVGRGWQVMIEPKKWEKGKYTGPLGLSHVNSALWSNYSIKCQIMALLFPHIYMLFLWFSFLSCNIEADSQNFLGCCKWNLISGSTVLIRAEKEWGGELKGKFTHS